MFLKQLNFAEKEAFISLGLKAAMVNDIITTEEYAMLEEYCKEMGIAFFDARNEKDMDTIIEVYSKSTLTHKNIVIFELIGLMFADGNYDQVERNFIESLADKLKVDNKLIQKYEEYIIEYIDLVKKIYENL